MSTGVLIGIGAFGRDVLRAFELAEQMRGVTTSTGKLWVHAQGWSREWSESVPDSAVQASVWRTAYGAQALRALREARVGEQGDTPSEVYIVCALTEAVGRTLWPVVLARILRERPLPFEEVSCTLIVTC